MEPVDEDVLEWEEWRPDQGSFTAHMVAGSIAGITEHTVMYPVDTLKTHVQCERCGKMAQPGVRTGTEGCIYALNTLVRNEGLSRLWRGVGTMFVACIPAHAAYFSVYETTKERFGANKPGHHPVAAAASGVLATLAHDSIMNPMDTIKQRLQLGYYKGIRHCVKQMVRYEGISSFFVSLPTSLAMNLPFGAIMVTSNESLKKVLVQGKESEATISTYLIAGSGAGAIASVATTPLDMIKTRLQTQNFSSFSSAAAGSSSLSSALPHPPSSPVSSSLSSSRAAPLSQQTRHAFTLTARDIATSKPPLRLHGALDAARAIYQEAGLAGFMRGVVPRLLVSSPSVAISWTAYEVAKSFLKDRL
mmetsp:Transcript_5281/g.15500  ORF Transcript_5281/g.15500 Transcript_5281/m.15500 type:complete len:361 (-) Transcript_5281:168-1250(-)